MATLLSYVQTKVTVDVDSMDPDVASRHKDACSFMDMTSNQGIVFNELCRDERTQQILHDAIVTCRSDILEEDQIVENVVDLATVLLAKAVYPYLTGSVHAQTSPSFAYDTEKTIQHAKKLVSVFEANDIPRARVCIKIPATAPSIVACQYLEKIGIRTLATCLFSVPQALAASQAGCKYVAPYFNELRVHLEPNLWTDYYSDTLRRHPMCSVIKSIVDVYKQIGSKTLVMPASIITTTEVLALVSLGIDHLTLSGFVLDHLADVPDDLDHEDYPSSTTGIQQPAAEYPNPIPDYLADNSHALKLAIEADPEVSRKLADALKIFAEMEGKTKDLIRSQLHI